jgi:hypothetical protein
MAIECNRFYADLIEGEKSPVAAYIVTPYDVMVELNVGESVAEKIIERIRDSQDSVWQAIWRDAQYELSLLMQEDPIIDLMEAANEAADPNPENGQAVEASAAQPQKGQP